MQTSFIYDPYCTLYIIPWVGSVTIFWKAMEGRLRVQMGCGVFCCTLMSPGGRLEQQHCCFLIVVYAEHF